MLCKFRALQTRMRLQQCDAVRVVRTKIGQSEGYNCEHHEEVSMSLTRGHDLLFLVQTGVIISQ
jgi:hypothetical protein